MNRTTSLKEINKVDQWDIVIVGGGASGLGAAVDAAQRGYKTLLLEKNDFAKGTSSRSTKLVHGGVRYLQNGDISLVIEALKERGIMKRNAPHLVKEMSFVIPFYDWWNSPFYGLGLKVYDMMAGNMGLGPSTLLDKKETVELINNVKQEGLKGGVIYHDGQFDDSRMAITLGLTATDIGATLINYVEVTGLTKQDNLISGLEILDHESGDQFTIKTKVVINATGVFSDLIVKMDQPQAQPMIRPSQGVHLVLERSFLDGPHAIMIPHTSDGRVLFAVPWYDHVVLGTTDTPIDLAIEEPTALEEEINFILSNASQYMTKKPKREDVKSVFVGLRPLASQQGDSTKTKEVSRHHKVNVSNSGLVSVLGGKWTTYRKIGEDTINTASVVGDLKEKKCKTKKLLLHGYDDDSPTGDPLHVYGSEREKILSMGKPEDNDSLSEKFYISKNTILWGVQNEMAIHLEDVLARRVRCLFLDAEETLRIAPKVAGIMAIALEKDENWVAQELKQFKTLSKNYIL
ncbi:MAG: glycerol-3-phosphate dehydrogenase/oxidase [Flavobacteriaceae bacterium]|nr:glycerol-3-phosphate dehydrogenase/oxidase [Flavobacteriaceae bacterium]